jgi:hypothetical protein
MAGKIVGIVSLERETEFRNRLIVQAMSAVKHNSEINVQPIDGRHAYFIVKNRLKADAISDFDKIMLAYKKLGGKEFSENILTKDAPLPTFNGLTNDKAATAPETESRLRLHDPEWCREHGVALPR